MQFERDDQLFEKLVDRQVLPGSTYLTFARDTVLTDDGKPRTREVLLHPGAVTIVALLSDQRMLLVRQYRHAAGEILLELPAGTLDMLDDGSVEEPLSAAKRELFEETGVLVATLDLAQAKRHRAAFGFFRDRRPELYGRLTEDF